MTYPRAVPWRFSWIKHVDTSPAHYVHAVNNEVEETLSMRLGTGGHALIFGTPPVVVYQGRRAGKDWEAFQAEHAGHVILNENEYQIASGIANALRSDMDADALLFAPGTRHEVDVEWTIEGRACRGRVDALGPEALVDLKCVKDSGRRWFPAAAARAHYHAQVAWYRDGLIAAGIGERQPYLVAVENKPPFVVTVWRMTDAAIEHGRRTYRRWLEALRRCEESNVWPGYSSSVLDFNVPAYLVGEEQSE